MKTTFAALIALFGFTAAGVIAHDKHDKKDVTVDKTETVTTEESKTSEGHPSETVVVTPAK